MDGPLHGTRVLDLGARRPVPYATALLAELDADVLKRCVALDLESGEGRTAALELAGEVDVVAEGFRAGVAERLGVGYDDVAAHHPHVVYCAIRDRVAGHDANYRAAAGIVALERLDGADRCRTVSAVREIEEVRG